MGRILPMNRTRCSSRNQRRLSKAIRRARALGFMPIWSRHPHQKIEVSYDGEQVAPGPDTFSGSRGAEYAGQLARSPFLAQN